MTAHSFRRFPRPTRGLWRPRPWRTIRLWYRAWRGALAAEHAYETARAQGAPRDTAAVAAFAALTSDDGPASPEHAAGAAYVREAGDSPREADTGTNSGLAPPGAVWAGVQNGRSMT